ncbi:MAG TPA: ankyrin repeat domain-containing protein [Rectinemataceae bacterium]|nr:ankyrin repeat domain-containing protein [Rectinemataceae bacterium]
MKKLFAALVLASVLVGSGFSETAKSDAVLSYLRSPALFVSINMVEIRFDGKDLLADAATKTIADALANGADINAVDKDGKSALWILINMALPQSILPGFVMTPSPDARRDEFIARNATMLIDKGIKLDLVDKATKSSALILAIKAGFNDLALKMIDKGADISLADKDGQNALRMACVYDTSGDVVSSLLNKGAKAAEAYAGPLFGYKGWTALHYAAAATNLAAVTILVQSGADVAALDGSKMSVLARAVSGTANSGDAYEIAEYLLFNGASIDANGVNSAASMQQSALKANNYACLWLLSPKGMASVNAFLKFRSVPTITADDVDNSIAKPDDKTMKYLVARAIVKAGTFSGKEVKDFRVKDLAVVKEGKNGAVRVNLTAYALYVKVVRGSETTKDSSGKDIDIPYYYRVYSVSAVTGHNYEFRTLKDDFDEWYATSM